ncbi:DUF4197 domain-containing protein [Desulfuromonas thiophila]|uniref:DUF4197 domain-containing protein n=1 Tax=Desulfuromonas thiophila TaxID=57664 RepID=A0A1G6WSZ8_9BACT|nr:DUF4197 domain-containing protein [Desulfuromonas thiophila]SDD69002.1 Protein of unknown function [Desulfuromonas thiophila]
MKPTALLTSFAALLATASLLSASPALSDQNSTAGNLLRGLSSLAGGLGQQAVAPAGSSIDAGTAAAGLKEALRVGAERAVAATSAQGGFLDNPQIHIPLPGKLDTMARALRAVGLSGQVDALEVGMNRAAEQAAAEAKPVLVEAVSQMTLPDALGILRGGDTAATDYFRATTSNSLRERFKPIVQNQMSQVGVYQQYNQLLQSYNALPLAKKPSLNLEDYVVEKGLAGLFTVLGQQEQAIRANPAARTTSLLQQVFGR